MRFSRTRLTDVLNRRHSASLAPRPVGSWRGDGSVEGDQAVAVRPGVENLPTVTPGLLIAVSDQQREASIRVADDLVKLDGRVAVAEVARPATQESVEIPNHLLDWPAQPIASGELAHPVAGTLRCLPRGPTCEERDMLEPPVSGAHPAMVKAQEVQALPTFSEMHDPSLRRLRCSSRTWSCLVVLATMWHSRALPCA
jgi:hypothetical protein